MHHPAIGKKTALLLCISGDSFPMHLSGILKMSFCLSVGEKRLNKEMLLRLEVFR